MPLPQLCDFPQDKVEPFRDVYRNVFNEADAQWVKDKERITNHDVKAVGVLRQRRHGAYWSWSMERVCAFWVDVTRREQHGHSAVPEARH